MDQPWIKAGMKRDSSKKEWLQPGSLFYKNAMLAKQRKRNAEQDDVILVVCQEVTPLIQQ
jgi:hypothetical protein